MYVSLSRYFRSDIQTRGVLGVYDGGEAIFKCLTLELPWKGNEKRVSCIPPGPDQPKTEYMLHHRSGADSGSFNYPHFIVRHVPSRDYILIHRGNLYTDILGCILVGESFVDINNDGHPDVVSSTETLSRLREVVPPSAPFRVGFIDVDGPVPAAEPEPIDISTAVEVPTGL